MDEYVKNALKFVDAQLHNELREFYKPIRKMLMQLALPEPEIRYREKIVEIESLEQKKKIERLQRQLAAARKKWVNPLEVITNPEKIRADSILRAMQEQPHLY